MSRNSKNAQRTAQRKQMSATRKGGGSGPSRTEPKHGKKNAWWQKFASYGAFIRGGKKGRGSEEASTEA